VAILRQIQFKNIQFNRLWIHISGIIDTNGLLNFIIINLCFWMVSSFWPKHWKEVCVTISLQSICYTWSCTLYRLVCPHQM